MHDLRTLLLRALLFDLLGQVLILAVMLSLPAWTGITVGGDTLQGQGSWLIFVLVLYPLLGWLFGSYTVLRWRRMALPVLLQRLLITGVVTLMVVAIARWLINPSDAVWLVYRRVQLLWIGSLTLWALAVRVGLRRGLLLPAAPRLLLLVQPQELESLLTAWQRVPHRHQLCPVEMPVLKQQLDRAKESALVALGEGVRQDPALQTLLAALEMRDPRQVRVMSVLSLFEQQQERLPPFLMADTSLAYDDLPWAATFSMQAQLKRMADLLVASLLLILTSPLIVVAAVLIWLDDRGPIFYSQQRSGWLGRPFNVYKLRTMSVQPANAPAEWTQVGDQRITPIGGILRRVRLDELPQLLNVLNGEMSLIGPRPGRRNWNRSLSSAFLITANVTGCVLV